MSDINKALEIATKLQTDIEEWYCKQSKIIAELREICDNYVHFMPDQKTEETENPYHDRDMGDKVNDDLLDR